jgi:hypothetical protein
MSRNYAIACETCQQFLDLGGLCPSEELSRHKLLSSIPAFQRTEVSAQDILQELAFHNPDNIWPGLADAIQNFVAFHQTHNLIALESGGDWPWWPDEPDWFVWKRISGPFFRPATSQSDIDLPRNIIDDLGITNWSNALAHYRAKCPSVLNPEDLEPIFLSLVAARA